MLYTWFGRQWLAESVEFWQPFLSGTYRSWLLPCLLQSRALQHLTPTTRGPGLNRGQSLDPTSRERQLLSNPITTSRKCPATRTRIPAGKHQKGGYRCRTQTKMTGAIHDMIRMTCRYPMAAGSGTRYWTTYYCRSTRLATARLVASMRLHSSPTSTRSLTTSLYTSEAVPTALTTIHNLKTLQPDN